MSLKLQFAGLCALLLALTSVPVFAGAITSTDATDIFAPAMPHPPMLSGWIAASPNPCVFDQTNTCMVTVSWGSNAPWNELRVSLFRDNNPYPVDGFRDLLVAAGGNGSVTAPWIQGPGQFYEFTLRGGFSQGGPTMQLASIDVSGHAPVPEPGTLALFATAGTGFFAFGVVQRRRRPARIRSNC